MKTIVVTGANKGIGKATVERILRDHGDTRVLLGSRDLARGQQAREELLTTAPQWEQRLSVLQIDVGDDASVQQAATELPPDDGLYAVVNNAGIGFGDADMQQTLNVNTLGVRRVCEAFIPRLDPEQGRVVNVTSASGPNFVSGCDRERQRFFVNAEQDEAALWQLLKQCVRMAESGDSFRKNGLGDGASYGLSKALCNTYTILLARRYPKLRINACTPGFIETDMTRPQAQRMGKSPSAMGMKSPAEGTRATLHLLFGEVASGHYYGSDALRSPMHRYRSPGDPEYTGDEEPL